MKKLITTAFATLVAFYGYSQDGVHLPLTGGTLTGGLTGTSATFSSDVKSPKIEVTRGGLNRNGAFLNNNLYLDNLAMLDLYPTSGTNVGSSLRIVPRGNGFSSGVVNIKGDIQVFNSDAVASPFNMELISMRGTGPDGFGIFSYSTGSGTIRPIWLSATGGISSSTANLILNTDRSSSFNGKVNVGGQPANLDPAAGSITYLQNSGKMVIGWNRSAYEGETDFIANQGAGQMGGFAFYNYDNAGTETEMVKFKGNGNVGIGVTNPDSKLAVNGTIHSKEVKVDMNGWNDKVFDAFYALRPLSEVKEYINKYRHLPEIPSEKDVIKEGINLGEMNKLLVKKVEEVTLYLIEKDDAIKAQALINEQQQQKNAVQENQINNMQSQINAMKLQIEDLMKRTSEKK